MSKNPNPGNIVLENVPWQDLETIIFRRQKNTVTRLAYDNKKLELFTPSPEHQEYSELLEEFITILLEEHRLNYRCFGSTLWQREDLQISIEADSSFYIQNFPAIHQVLTISLPENPPPDLVLEVDLTRKSLSRRSIYSRLGVPEIWRCDEKKLQIYHLRSGQYERIPQSLIFPELPLESLPLIIKDNLKSGRAGVRNEFQKWLRVVISNY